MGKYFVMVMYGMRNFPSIHTQHLFNFTLSKCTRLAVELDTCTLKRDELKAKRKKKIKKNMMR